LARLEPARYHHQVTPAEAAANARQQTLDALRSRANTVCVAVSGAQMLALASSTVGRNPFLEFRLDSIPDPGSVLDDLRSFLLDHPKAVAIATCRRKAFGGSFSGSAEEQVALLQRAAAAGCRICDLEVETAEELGPEAIRQLRSAGASVVLSWHDFAATPPLEAVYERLARFQPDLIKIVPTAQSLTDALALINLLERHAAGGHLVAMSMGLKGFLTRILGPRFGSVFTFASPDGDAGTAPGQVGITRMLDLFRVPAITASTQIFAVAGSPIGGSMSPLIHNTAFAAESMDAVYLPLETSDSQELRSVIDRLDIRGLSITMPLKETVLPLLAHADPMVEATGACNTLLRSPDGKLTGFNTDIAGVIHPLSRLIPLQGARVLVLGAGGAARATIFGLRKEGARVWVLNRSTEKAERLALETGAEVQPRATLAETDFDAMVNSTPYGMRNQEMEAPILPEEMRCRVFFDLVYNPIETPLIGIARDRGIEVIPGIAMFVEQGVRQFELWTHRAAPESEMLRVLREALEA
jgi:3-dehydroquinate dehydratase/shikimate dehydrogenase